ncbi:binary toxin-like calcium binding domain-containing protein [Bacillus pseudomycoides]|uniref:binary toxin-like calcium binding domain-containing protein n=1 Tax=Bacillus pseudomycoides TaxID=64104 RepID=UPI003D64AB99
MKKLKPTLSVLGSVSMALTLASPALADIKQPDTGSTIEMFKEDANAKEGKDLIYGTDGKKGTMSTEKIKLQNNDWDEDGISNDLEIKGYKIEFNRQTGKNEAQAWDPERDKDKLKFITNPMSANSDLDPFSDAYEVQYYGSNSDTEFNPMVANIPNLQIGIKRIGVTPLAAITDSNGGSIDKGWEKSVSTQHSFNVGLSGEGGKDATGPSGKASLNVSYGYSKTSTDTERYSSKIDWSTAKTVDSAKAAKVSLQLEYKNTGTASAQNVSPHFNIRLGDKIINTVKATQDRYKANQLSTEKGGRNTTEVLIDSVENQADVNIYLSLDELKAVEQGAPLSVEVLPTSTMDLYIQKDGKYMTVGDSGQYESDVNASTVLLETDIGNKPKFRIYAPAGHSSEQNLTFNEVLKHVKVDSTKINEFIDNSNGDQRIIAKDNLENAKESYVSEGAKVGVFTKIQQPELSYSAYDPFTKKFYASVVPGLFGASNEISVSFENKNSKQTQQVTLVRKGNVYESKENVSLNDFNPLQKVTFEINDAQKKLPTQKISTVVTYNKEYEDYLTHRFSDELIVEGTPYTLRASGYPVQSYHGHNKWQYLVYSGYYAKPVNVIIERKGQPKPGQPIKKGEEVHIKVQNSVHSGYEYLKLQDGYIHFDQKQNASTFKFNHIHSPGSLDYQREWNLQSDGNNIGLSKSGSGYVEYGSNVNTGLYLDKWSFVKAE